ncbi:hypothetical protein [Halalkalibacter akibai]|nr:hypothetical protein [Halalkalibacter akibai]
MKKGAIIWIIIAIGLVVIGLIVPVSTKPADETRVIIDHTKNVYSSPACFDQAGLTNNLEETTFGYAIQIGYESESSCTETEYFGKRKPFLLAIFE